MDGASWIAAVLLAMGSVQENDANRAEVDLTKGSGPIHVAPDGSYWIGTRSDWLYVSRDKGRSWHGVEVEFERSPSSNDPTSDLTFVGFFDESVGILPAIYNGLEWPLSRTEDGGSTWQQIELPLAMRFYDTHLAPDGSAWLVGHAKRLLVSEDRGATWTPSTPPFDGEIRPCSVHFVSRSRGVVGSNGYNLAITGDGGATWSKLPAPREVLAGVKMGKGEGPATAGSSNGPSGPVTKVRLVGEILVALQQRATYWTTLDDAAGWKPLTLADEPVLDFEVHPDGLAIVSAAGAVVVLDGKMTPLWKTKEAIPPASIFQFGYVECLSVDGEDVLVFDHASRLHRVRSGELVESTKLLLDAGEARWNIAELDLGVDGIMWGATEQSLYKSPDHGRSWIRVEELPASLKRPAPHIAIAPSGDLFLWGYEQAFRWSEHGGGFRSIPELEGLDLVDVDRRPELWLAYGMRDKPEPDSLSIHRSYAQEGITGLVLASTDGGATWATLHEWPGGRIESLFLTEGGTLCLYRAGGGVRRGSVSTAPLRATLETVVEPDEEASLHFDYGARLFFRDERRGVLQGGFFYDDDRAFVTEDGGTTWSSMSASDDWAYQSLHRLGSGVWVRVSEIGSFARRERPDAPERVDALSRGSEALSKSFPEIARSHVDATGCLLVQLDDGALWSLSADASSWTELRGPRR